MTYIYQDNVLIGPVTMEKPVRFGYKTRHMAANDVLFDYNLKWSAYHDHLNTLPRYPVQGEHNWINGQEVGEGEFRIEVNPNLEVEFAIPIHKETKPEQGESEREGLIKIRNYFGEHDKTPFEHWAYNFLNKLLTTNQ